jgi:hydrophobic/amphiphilic exporter-1 (mainly G- bacteria), HAE1 family
MVALCLVMGVYSFSRLQTDLFPDVEFPVITVTTVYPGRRAGGDRDAGHRPPRGGRLDAGQPRRAAVVLAAERLDPHHPVRPRHRPGPGGDRRARPGRDRARADAGGRRVAGRPEVRARARCPSSRWRWPDRRASTRSTNWPTRTCATASRACRRGRDRHRRRPGARGGGARPPERLRAYGLTLDQVVTLIGAENVSVPGGRITEPGADVPVRVIGEYQEVRELEDLRLVLADDRVARWPTSRGPRRLRGPQRDRAAQRPAGGPDLHPEAHRRQHGHHGRGHSPRGGGDLGGAAARARR